MVEEDHDRPLGGRDLLGLGGMLVAAVVGCTVLGLLLDHLAGSSPLGVVLGVALGMLLGATGFVLRVRRALRVPPDDPADPADPADPRNEVTP
jgi:F0F1-type ATP synthase assembly protein I